MDAMNRHSIEVWSLSLRLFHWLLAVLFFTAWWTSDGDIRLHIFAGSAIAGLLLYRYIWGFIGERYARFASFIPSAAELQRHVLDLISLQARTDIGHTPIGSLMIFMLLASLSVAVVSGFLLVALQMNIGPFCGWQASYNSEVFIQSIHAGCFEVLWVLIAIHLLGVAVESLLQRSNLIVAMVTGKKQSRRM